MIKDKLLNLKEDERWKKHLVNEAQTMEPFSFHKANQDDPRPQWNLGLQYLKWKATF